MLVNKINVLFFFVIYSCSKWSVKMNVSIFIWLLHIFCSINQFEVSTSIIQIASCKLHAPLYTVWTWNLTYWYLQFFPKPGMYWSIIKSHGNNIIVSHVYIIICIIYLASCKGMGWGGGWGGVKRYIHYTVSKITLFSFWWNRRGP